MLSVRRILIATGLASTSTDPDRKLLIYYRLIKDYLMSCEQDVRL